MLVLTRKVGEFLLLGEDIEIRVVRIDGDQIRIGIVAPRHIAVVRGELIEDIRSETAASAKPMAASVQDLSRRMKKEPARHESKTQNPT